MKFGKYKPKRQNVKNGQLALKYVIVIRTSSIDVDIRFFWQLKKIMMLPQLKVKIPVTVVPTTTVIGYVDVDVFFLYTNFTMEIDTDNFIPGKLVT